MDEETKKALQYRFQGYQLPKVNFDAGFPSYVMNVHPYYINQPEYWQKACFFMHPGHVENNIVIGAPLYPMQPFQNNSDNSNNNV